MPWSLDKHGVTPDIGLTEVEQGHLNEFMDKINRMHQHPREACSGWDSQYELLAANQYCIRLSQSRRAYFIVDGVKEIVRMTHVGTHQ